MDDGLGVGLLKNVDDTLAVLILVLMDDGLGEDFRLLITLKTSIVLILVLMDDGLGEQKFQSTIYQINKAQIL